MAKLTLLDMTQNILSAMDSDSVNSLGDTVESLQVAEIIKETYFDIVSGRDWPFLKSYTSLVGLGDVSNPTKMEFPETADKVYWIKYNKKTIFYMTPEEFQDMLDLRVTEAGVVDSNGFFLTQDPQYWTTFDDTIIFFDSINLVVDTTLQQSKSKAYMLLAPDWELDNQFIPTLPDKMFPLLLADAKSTCFLNLKQVANAKEERKAQRLRVRMQGEARRAKDATHQTNEEINYGRSSGTRSIKRS